MCNTGRGASIHLYPCIHVPPGENLSCKDHRVYQVLTQQRKLDGMGLRVLVDHSYFGEAGESDGLQAAPDRYYGTIIDWTQKRSKDPKIKARFDG